MNETVSLMIALLGASLALLSFWFRKNASASGGNGTADQRQLETDLATQQAFLASEKQRTAELTAEVSRLNGELRLAEADLARLREKTENQGAVQEQMRTSSRCSRKKWCSGRRPK